MKKANLYWLVALAFAASEARANNITVCNVSTKVCTTRVMTAQEQTAYDNSVAQSIANETAIKPHQPITRRQLKQAFVDCSSAGTAGQILICIRDNLITLETQ